jgi:hypothetical protein
LTVKTRSSQFKSGSRFPATLSRQREFILMDT